MSERTAKAWATIFASAAAAIVAVVVALGQVGVFDDDPPPAAAPIFPGVTFDKDNNVSPAEKVESGARPLASSPAVPELANVGPDIHEDARDETPPGISRDEADDALVNPPGLRKPQPFRGGAQTVRCDSHPVRNWSYRASGVRVSQFVLHFTVSPPGSINGIRAMFDNPSSGASSHIGLELDGECQQWVDWAHKAWTAGAFNSASDQVEIVTNNLTRNEWLAAPILRDAILARIIVERLKARGLPPTLVDPEGCTPRAGVTDHNRLECGNNHWDVGPGFPWDKLMAQVRQLYKHGAVCDRKCAAKRKQKNVVDGRIRKHAELHERYTAAGCRRNMHERRLREYTRPECKALKRKGHSQHLGVTRAKRKLRSL